MSEGDNMLIDNAVEEGIPTYWDCACGQRNSNRKENCKKEKCQYWKCKNCNEVTLENSHCSKKPETFWFCENGQGGCKSQNSKTSLWCNTYSSVGRCQNWFCSGCEKVMNVGTKCTCPTKKGPQFWICEIKGSGCGINNPKLLARCSNESCFAWVCQATECSTFNAASIKCKSCNGFCPPMNSGLVNKKNYCYINSMIWAMHLTNYSNLDFLGVLNDDCKSSPTFHVYNDLIHEMQRLWTFLDNRSENTKPYDPTKFIESFRVASEIYYTESKTRPLISDYYEQNDPSEFLTELLKIAEYYCRQFQSLHTENTIELSLNDRIVCDDCKTENVRISGTCPFVSIVLSGKRKDTSMQSLVDYYLEGCELEKRCCSETCKNGDKKHKSYRVVTFSPSQQFLLVHISGVGLITFKEDGVINFPQSLIDGGTDLSPQSWTLIGAIMYTGTSVGNIGHYFFVTEKYVIDDTKIIYDEERFIKIKKCGFDAAYNKSHGILYMFKRGGCSTTTSIGENIEDKRSSRCCSKRSSEDKNMAKEVAPESKKPRPNQKEKCVICDKGTISFRNDHKRSRCSAKPCKGWRCNICGNQVTKESLQLQQIVDTFPPECQVCAISECDNAEGGGGGDAGGGGSGSNIDLNTYTMKAIEISVR